MSIGIVDIGIGNLGSVRQALHVQGWDVVFVSNPDDLHELTHLFLPGVGAFKTAIQRLHRAKLFTAIRNFAEKVTFQGHLRKRSYVEGYGHCSLHEQSRGMFC